MKSVYQDPSAVNRYRSGQLHRGYDYQTDRVGQCKATYTDLLPYTSPGNTLARLLTNPYRHRRKLYRIAARTLQLLPLVRAYLDQPAQEDRTSTISADVIEQWCADLGW